MIAAGLFIWSTFIALVIRDTLNHPGNRHVLGLPTRKKQSRLAKFKLHYEALDDDHWTTKRWKDWGRV